MEQVALIMNNTLSCLVVDTLLSCDGNWQFLKSLVCDYKKTWLLLSGFSPHSWLLMTDQSMSVMDTFENDNEAF